MRDGRQIKQVMLTPAAGKRLIARALLQIPAIQEALVDKTVVVVAGTTNGYVAEEILGALQQQYDFSKEQFFRGITLPPKYKVPDERKIHGQNDFPGDVVIVKGKWEQGKTIFDVVDALKKGDVVLKGANALDLENRLAGVYIGHPKVGTMQAVLQAAVGKRASLYLPVGLEKRISGNLNHIARKLNGPNASGPRLLPVVGEIVTELEALQIITGVEAELVAAGGVCGAEGSCWLAITGTHAQLESAETLVQELGEEPPFQL